MPKSRKYEYPQPEDRLLRDLEVYRNHALEVGASDAKIIRSDELIFDPRAWLKCRYPKCQWYGTNAHCPPYEPDSEDIKKRLRVFKFGILYRILVDPEEYTGEYYDGKGKSIPARNQKLNFKIASLVEARAYYDGYAFAIGFSGGPCKSVFCQDKECSALIPGEACRAAGKARTSMEGAGLNAIAMAIEAGWDVYPCAAHAEEAPYGTSLGLIMID